MPLDEQYFTDKIDEVTKDAMAKEAVAPTKGGWDPIFRKRIESKRNVMQAWKNSVQSIIEKASFFGYDLSTKYAAAKLDDE